eukprot:3181384-Amphidinium_carterae.1
MSVHTLDELWELNPQVLERFTTSLTEIGRRYGLPTEPSPSEVEAGEFTYVSSYKGDDEAISSRLQCLGPFMWSGASVQKIALSGEDVGQNSWGFNLTERWELVPPSIAMCFDISGKLRNSYIPWTLDSPNLKLGSAVRKESALEMDLESKYLDLYHVVQW